MPAETPQRSSYALTLSGEERATLLGLLRQALGETRVEAHRTHTPDFRDLVLGQEALLGGLVGRLAGLRPEGAGTSATAPAGTEEGAAVTDDLYLDKQGRFQMTMEDLRDFLGFLRDNKVSAGEEAADAFRSGGKAYGYGRLDHPFDADSVKDLYRSWQVARAGRPAGGTA